MFGSQRPVVFDPYRHHRARGGVPRWLALLGVGALLGAAAVLYVEQRVLPPRLTMEASTELRQSFERAESERARLAGELATTGKQLAATLSEAKKLAGELTAARGANDGLKANLAALVATLPPDPRGGEVQVRAARFVAAGGALSYDLVLTRDRSARPLDGTLQFVVSGTGREGREATVSARPVALSIGSHEVLRGSVELPEGFTPRQTTVTVLDRAARQLGMRVLRVG